MNRRLLIETLFNRINELSIEKVFLLYEEGEVKKQGSYYKCLCPFHDDQHIGSFVIFTNTNSYYCFACGEGGRASNYVSKKFRLSLFEAALKIGIDFNLLPREELLFLSGGKTREDEIVVKEFQRKNPIKFEEERIASVEKRDKVYNIFLNNLDLSEEDYNYLRRRNLNDKEIKKAGFKSLTYNTNVMGALKNAGLTYKDLEGVPGFFKARDKDDFWVWKHMSSDAIVMPLRDEEGLIYSLQLRKKSGNLRYTFFTSSFANKDNMTEGTSAKSGYDINIPLKTNSDILFITEGKFKALAINKIFLSPAISLQGVTSWNEGKIMSVINRMKDKGVKRIVLAFDADYKENDAVKKALEKLYSFLKSRYKNTKAITWDLELGKGIDDYFYQNTNTPVQVLIDRIYEVEF